MDDYYGDDAWDYGRQRRRPSPHQMRSDYRNGLLDPGFAASGLYRSRSQGHGPAPTINVYNRMYQDQEGSPRPPPYPPSSSSQRASPRASPDGRGRRRFGDTLSASLSDELAGMALEHRLLSQSRGRSDASGFDRPPPGMAEWQLAQREAEIREASRERAWRDKVKVEALEAELKKEREDEASRGRERRWKEKYKLDELEREMKREKEEEAAKEREKRLIAEHERKTRDAEEKKKADEKRAVEEWERRQREAKEKAAEEERRIKEKMEREKKEAREKEEAAYREFKEKERKDKEEKEARYNDFLREQKEREEKKKQEAKAAEEKFQAEMRKRLQNLGYSERTIEIMIDEEKTKKFRESMASNNQHEAHGVVGGGHRSRSSGHRSTTTTTTTTTTNPLGVGFRAHKAPVYPKIHRNFIALETLKYYGLPWEYDRTNPEYIIILRDMDSKETDLLFEHTKRLNSGRLLIEGAKRKEPRLAMYRRRSRSGAPREVGVLRWG
ncbi:Hypothetical predicted protein [Lecanosticta acicola]|uniref:Uncharacterized protein n=1 Tax=Lecanosticta acicola TaxID=111012 RepID=A0AAI8YXM8_9PEZI|nr:Hypothetical predicted protein [Lecanosticta acicola]